MSLASRVEAAGISNQILGMHRMKTGQGGRIGGALQYVGGRLQQDFGAVGLRVPQMIGAAARAAAAPVAGVAATGNVTAAYMASQYFGRKSEGSGGLNTAMEAAVLGRMFGG